LIAAGKRRQEEAQLDGSGTHVSIGVRRIGYDGGSGKISPTIPFLILIFYYIYYSYVALVGGGHDEPAEIHWNQTSVKLILPLYTERGETKIGK